jgi:hypothetical protein
VIHVEQNLYLRMIHLPDDLRGVFGEHHEVPGVIHLVIQRFQNQHQLRFLDNLGGSLQHIHAVARLLIEGQVLHAESARDRRYFIADNLVKLDRPPYVVEKPFVRPAIRHRGLTPASAIHNERAHRQLQSVHLLAQFVDLLRRPRRQPVVLERRESGLGEDLQLPGQRFGIEPAQCRAVP